MIGPMVAAVGMLWLSRITPGSDYVASLLGPGLLTAIGFGLSVPPATLAGTSGVARQEAGLASGLFNTNRQVGASIVLAALATVAADRTTALLGSSSAPASVRTAVTSGYARGFGFAVVICLAAALVAWRVLPARQPSLARDEAPAVDTPDESLTQCDEVQAVPEVERA
ncbi:MAG: hypothetical protein M3Q23_12560 [Actinomycetota bacterium]|nr:hypothetical protein [Actinomycetota bacterium]